MINRAKKAFTLLELIVVIVILGIIAGLAVPTFLSVTTKSRQQVAVNEAKAFARDITALAAFTTGADASDFVTEADDEIAGSYSNGTYTASNGCTVAVTVSGDAASAADSASC